MNKLLKIGITCGDHNGVGYEIIEKTLSDERLLELFTPVVYGNKVIWEDYADRLGISFSTQIKEVTSPTDAQAGQINLIEINTTGINIHVAPGTPDRDAGVLAARALVQARKDVMAGYTAAVVTAPINKDNIQSDEFRFNGHTEFFTEPYPGVEPTMLFVKDSLRVALLTMHLPLKDAAQKVTLEQIERCLNNLEKTLVQDFAIEKPRIAVMGLNPHAGENGLLGNEELKVLIPAIDQAWQSGKLVFGPFPSDGYWGRGDYNKFDATLAIYHDQGLVPFKLLAMQEGVNVTAGLPIIRTSPDHGTAFDIAGQGIADPTSFRNAIYQAIDIYRNRQAYHIACSNPLQKRYVERGRDNVKLDLSKSSDED